MSQMLAHDEVAKTLMNLVKSTTTEWLAKTLGKPNLNLKVLLGMRSAI